jgi:pimeloyl-ACP methyl ester carboxylesterase
MSSLRYAVAVLVLLTTVGCGRSSPVIADPTAAADPNPPAEATCPADLPARHLRVPVGGEAIPVALLGSGTTTVIASNQSDEDLCSWQGFAQMLVANGFSVALWDYGEAGSTDELAAVVRAVRSDGATRVVLLGASKGAKTSLVTARRIDVPYVAGIVSLSAEATLSPGIDVADACAGLTIPTLLVTSTGDPYGSAEALDPIRHGIARAQVLRVAGSDHGTALLPDAGVSAVVLDFLRRITT